MRITRRMWLAKFVAAVSALGGRSVFSDETAKRPELKEAIKITGVRITPIALPDPPLLAAGGCHGPYFLRNVIELETNAGVVGIGETHGGERVTRRLEKAAQRLVGQPVSAYRQWGVDVMQLGNSVYAGLELACLDAIGRVTGRRLCDLLGGPVREQVEFASYLFFRYAADHTRVLSDPRTVDDRGRNQSALDAWGEVQTPEAMAEMAVRFQRRWGFRVHKLKAGVFEPDLELEALQAINERFDSKQLLRIDPNGRWTMKTALRIGQSLRDLPLEYYEDPVAGQRAMAEVRAKCGLPMSTNACVTRFDHIPDAIRQRPIDVVLGDHHGWGGIMAFQTLGRIAPSLGWELSQHSNNHAGITMAAMIHVGAITPELTHASDTHYVWLVDGADIIEGPNLRITDGKMAVPPAPGVGVRLDREKLAKAHSVYRKCGMRERNDSFTMRQFQPGWQRTLF